MSLRNERATTILLAIVHEIKAERITFMAGSIAYNAFLSLLPLLFLLLTVISIVGDQRLEDGLIQVTQTIVTPGASELLVAELRAAPVGASIVGLIALIWGMLRIFRCLDMAFSSIYETQDRNTFTNQLVDGTIVFCSLSVVVLGSAVLYSVVDIGGSIGGSWFAQRLLLVAVVALALAPMYYLFPDESGMTVREIVPGVLFTAVGLVTFESLFRLYTQYGGPSVDNSILAGILIFMTWLYFSGLIILLGVVINAVLSNRSEDVNIRPVFGGVPKAELDVDEDSLREDVPVEALKELKRTLPEAHTIEIRVDDGEPIRLPAPDMATVDAHTSSIPIINDTAGFELTWARGTYLGTFTEEPEFER